MVLYKPDCDSNDCNLPNEKATPSILATVLALIFKHSNSPNGKFKVTGDSLHKEIFVSNKLFVSPQGKQL